MPATFQCWCGEQLTLEEANALDVPSCPACGAPMSRQEESTAETYALAREPVPMSAPVPSSADLKLPPINPPVESAREPPEEAPPPSIPETWQESLWRAVQLYRDHWPEILRGVANLLPKRMVDDDYRWRQIRLERNAAWNGSRWKTALPEACVTCGFTRELSPGKRTFSCIDASRPAHVVLAALGAGAFLVLAWSFWWWVLYFVAVPALLWWFARDASAEKAVVQFHRCDQHAEDKEWPKVFRDKNQLVLLVGNSRVRKLWLSTSQEKAAPPAPDVLRAAREKAWQEHRERHARGPVLARTAGWIWLATGVLQWISAGLEFLFLAIFSYFFGAPHMAAMLFFLLVYCFLRFRAAQAFTEAGRDTISQEADDVLSNALASIGIGLIFLIPATLVLGEVSLPLIDTRSMRESPDVVTMVVSLFVWGLVLCTAGGVALAGRSEYLGQSQRKEPYCEVPCPACGGQYRVCRVEDFDNLVQCPHCGEAFRIGEG